MPPPTGIVATGVARAAATPLFFMYLYGWLPPLDDAVVVAYVAIFWFTSGCVTRCTASAASDLPPRSDGEEPCGDGS